MRKLASVLLAVLFTLGFRGAAFAQNLPRAFVFIDDVRFDLPVTQEGKLFVIGDPQGGPLSFDAPGGSITISATLDPDPSIVYGFGGVDIGAPSKFSFVVEDLDVFCPEGTPYIANASILGALTDTNGSGVSLTPENTSPPGPFPEDSDGFLEAQIFLANAGSGPPGFNLEADVGPSITYGAGTPGAFYPYGPLAPGATYGPGQFSVGPVAGVAPAGGITDLLLAVQFTLSGGGDAFGVTGFASLECVPEPGSWAVIGMGLLGLGGIAYRRKKK
jgi:hypothetical protein